MFIRRSQSFGRSLARPVSLSWCEPLEYRRLFAVTAGQAADGISPDELDATGVYEGTLRLRRADDQGRRDYNMTLEITDQGNGTVDGTVTIEPQDSTGGEEQTGTFSNGDFSSSPNWRLHIFADLSGEFDGLLDGHFLVSDEDHFAGGLRNAQNQRFGTFQLDEVATPT